MDDLMHSLPLEQLKLIPLQNDLPGLLEFDVPVLLQFNGQFVSSVLILVIICILSKETYLLREHLTTAEYETLTQIVNRKNVTEVVSSFNPVIVIRRR